MTLRPGVKTLGKINAQFLKKVFQIQFGEHYCVATAFRKVKESFEFFCKDSESSEESEEEGEDPSPWLSLWQPYNPWHKSQVAQNKVCKFQIVHVRFTSFLKKKVCCIVFIKLYLFCAYEITISP